MAVAIGYKLKHRETSLVNGSGTCDFDDNCLAWNAILIRVTTAFQVDSFDFDEK